MKPERAIFCAWVMAVQLMMMQITMMMGSAQAACQDNVQAANFAEGARLLKETVVACIAGTPFFMPTEGVNLLSSNIPNDFNTLNAQRALVETVYSVTQTATSQTWSITIDVDNATTGSRPQNSHYGYTIYGRNPTISKVTGHIFFPDGVYPPYVRPPLNTGDDPYNSVSFADASSRFSLSGVNYFLKLTATRMISY